MMLRAILTAGVAFSGSLPMAYGQATIPPGFEVIQLTQTPVRDAWPRINNHREIVYERRVNGTDVSGEIFLYDDRTGQTIRLTDDNVEDSLPDINDDGTIVWARFMGPNGPFGPTAEIMVRSPTGVISRLTDNDMNDWAPVVNSRGHMAWNREMGLSRCNRGPVGDIFFYDGSRIIAITTDGVPDDVYNQVTRLNDRDQIVWVRFDFCAGQGQRNWESQIRMYDNGAITTLTDGQVRPNSPDVDLSGLVAWFHRRPPNGDNEIQIWRDGETTVLTDWGSGPNLNDAGVVAFNRWHDDTQLWQRWLYRDGTFWQLSDDPFWNRDGNLNEIGDVVWRSGPTTTSNIRYMRRFSLGDLNCDRSIDALDIEPFILALFDPDEYRRAHPICDALLADLDQSGCVNALDIEPFINLLFP